MMDLSEIEAIIPHRAPFLWIERVEELTAGERCVAIKRIDEADPLFRGHFPRRPILPGVCLIEAMAQTAAVMLGTAGPTESDETPLLAAVNRVKFLRPVLPGSELRIVTKRVTESGRLICVEGTVSCDGATVATGELIVRWG